MKYWCHDWHELEMFEHVSNIFSCTRDWLILPWFFCPSKSLEYFFRAFRVWQVKSRKANPPPPPSHSFHVVSLRYPLMVKDDLCPAYFLSILCLLAVLIVLCERSPNPPNTACRSLLRPGFKTSRTLCFGTLRLVRTRSMNSLWYIFWKFSKACSYWLGFRLSIRESLIWGLSLCWWGSCCTSCMQWCHSLSGTQISGRCSSPAWAAAAWMSFFSRNGCDFEWFFSDLFSFAGACSGLRWSLTQSDVAKVVALNCCLQDLIMVLLRTSRQNSWMPAFHDMPERHNIYQIHQLVDVLLKVTWIALVTILITCLLLYTRTGDLRNP